MNWRSTVNPVVSYLAIILISLFCIAAAYYSRQILAKADSFAAPSDIDHLDKINQSLSAPKPSGKPLKKSL